MGLDSLYCGKWRKISKSRCDLDRTMPNVELVRAIFIYSYVQVSHKLNHYFLSYRVHRQTDRQTDTNTDRQTDTQTDRHTDNDEYSIVAVDKPQL